MSRSIARWQCEINRKLRAAAASILAAASTFGAVAAPGDPDTTFQITGRVHTVINGFITHEQFSTGEAWGQPAMALQSDGRIVIVGTCKIGANWDLCLLRYGGNGVIDTSFGVSGAVTTDLQGADDFAAGIAIQPDGKIVVAATCENTLTITTRRDFCVARYTTTGALDSTFSGTGIVRTSFSNFDDVATSMALQSDGKIVVAGYCGNSAAFDTQNTFGVEICVARYTGSGDLDTSFSGDGTLRTSIGGASASFVRNKANAVAIASDGKIVLTGSRYVGTASGFVDTDLLLVRLLPDGALDTSFSGDGIVTRAWTSWIYGSAVTIQPDGRILIAGYRIGGCGAPTECMIALRYNESGLPDATFGVSGVVGIDVSAVGTAAYTQSIALQSDGKIVLAGACLVDGGVSRVFCFARLHGDGSLDNSFSTDGIGSVSWRADGLDYGFAVAITRGGNIVLGGYCYPVNATEVAFCIARREGGAFGARNCSLDIDGDGRVLATTDMLIGSRVALGMSGSAVINGITFAANAARDEWGTNSSRDIRKYLITQCGMSIAP